MGGAAPSPTPSLDFFDAMQAGFQKPRTRDKGVCQSGGAVPPPPALNIMHAGFQENRTITTRIASST